MLGSLWVPAQLSCVFFSFFVFGPLGTFCWFSVEGENSEGMTRSVRYDFFVFFLLVRYSVAS